MKSEADESSFEPGDTGAYLLNTEKSNHRRMNLKY